MQTTDQTEKRESGSQQRDGSATPFLDAVQEIRTLREDAASKTTRLLESRGWRYTSQTPGCVWMFEKQVDGRTILTDSETALRHELENTDEQYEDLGG